MLLRWMMTAAVLCFAWALFPCNAAAQSKAQELLDRHAAAQKAQIEYQKALEARRLNRELFKQQQLELQQQQLETQRQQAAAGRSAAVQQIFAAGLSDEQTLEALRRVDPDAYLDYRERLMGLEQQRLQLVSQWLQQLINAKSLGIDIGPLLEAVGQSDPINVESSLPGLLPNSAVDEDVPIDKDRPRLKRGN